MLHAHPLASETPAPPLVPPPVSKVLFSFTTAQMSARLTLKEEDGRRFFFLSLFSTTAVCILRLFTPNQTKGGCHADAAEEC